jgi:DNA-binding transcriptional ArsR family regulator
MEPMEKSRSGESLLQNLLGSDSKAQLVVLFRRNPGLIDEIDAIARRVGKKKESVEADLNDLVEAGVVKRGQVGNVEVFSLDRKRDVEVQRAVGSYLMASQGMKASQ